MKKKKQDTAIELEYRICDWKVELIRLKWKASLPKELINCENWVTRTHDGLYEETQSWEIAE